MNLRGVLLATGLYSVPAMWIIFAVVALLDLDVGWAGLYLITAGALVWFVRWVAGDLVAQIGARPHG